MRGTLNNWNEDVAFRKMSRLSYQQIKELVIGEYIYYVNLEDDVTGVVYEAKVIGKTKYMIVMECTALKETVTGLSFTNQCSSHIESFAFVDALDQESHRVLFGNLIFKEDIVWKTELLRDSL